MLHTKNLSKTGDFQQMKTIKQLDRMLSHSISVGFNNCILFIRMFFIVKAEQNHRFN